MKRKKNASVQGVTVLLERPKPLCAEKEYDEGKDL
jgi:hypothetical protein